jgi:deazaflavin-dependent oxidoreductase (nitroreductase family)
MGAGRRLQRVVEKHLINRVMRIALRLGVVPGAFALLETTGRKTGRTRSTPVGNGLDGSTFWLVAEHGRNDYVLNLRADPRVRVKVRRRWLQGTATELPDDDGFARRRQIDRKNGLVGRLDGVLFRAAASTPVTFRIDLRG